jgi:hypothetical protein
MSDQDRVLNEVYVSLLRARTELLIQSMQSKDDDETVAYRHDLVHRLLGPVEIYELTESWLRLREIETGSTPMKLGDDARVFVPALASGAMSFGASEPSGIVTDAP